MSEELKPIRMDGKYQTRGGRAVRVLCVDREHEDYPVIALITETGNVEYPYSFTKYGSWREGADTKHDLIEVDEQVRYVNVYPESVGFACKTISEALANSDDDLTGTLKITHINGKLTSVEIVEV